MKFCFWLEQEKIELCIISLVILGSKKRHVSLLNKAEKKQFFHFCIRKSYNLHLVRQSL